MVTTTEPAPGVLARLGQTAVWASHDLHGRLIEHLIADMTAEHRGHALRWLRAHAADLHHWQAEHLAHRHRTGASTRVEFAAEIALLRARHPEEWLEQQPLVEHLARVTPAVRVAGRGAGILRRIRGWRA